MISRLAARARPWFIAACLLGIAFGGCSSPQLVREPNPHAPAGRLRDHIDVRLSVQKRSEPRPKQVVIVDDEHADWPGIPSTVIHHDVIQSLPQFCGHAHRPTQPPPNSLQTSANEYT